MTVPHDALPAVPPVGRRMLCFLYEGMLLFGVVFVTGLAYGLATQQRNAMQGVSGLHVALFLVLAVYFIGFWMHGGQTLAMKTWHIRLLAAGGRPLRLQQALARYLAAWLWFLPPLAITWASGLKSPAAYAGIPLLWIAGYSALALRHPRRQFLHDALCGTELVVAPRPVRLPGTVG